MQLHSLTSLRFFAAFAVVLSHLVFLGRSNSEITSNIYHSIFHEGYIGVTFFFILSGFILSHSYTDRLKSKSVDYLDFMFARVARIYPLHLFTLLIASPLFYFAFAKYGWSALSIFLFNSSLTHAFIPFKDIYFSLNGPSWSLSTEMFFYLLFPFLILLKTRYIVICISLILCFQFCVYSTFPMDDDPGYFLIYVFPLSRLIDFLIGIFLYRLFSLIIYDHISPLKATFLQLTSLMLLIVFFVLKDNVPQYLRYDLYYILPMGFLIYSFAFNKGLLSKAISNKFLVLLGEASFALYLVHFLVIRYAGYIVRRILEEHSMAYDITLSTISIVLSIILSVILFLFFEKRAKVFTLGYLKQIRRNKKI